MNKKGFAVILLTALMSIGISGCGKADVSAPAADSETPSIAEQSSEQADILVIPDDLSGEGYKKYEGQMITVVGYPGFYTKFSDEDLKKLGEGALFVTSSEEFSPDLLKTGKVTYCIFDDDQAERFNDDVCGEIRRNDKLIGITGLCSGANLTGCDPEFKTYDIADVPFYSNQREADAEKKTDSEPEKKETKTSSIPADTVIEEYKNNEAAADQKYANRSITITGTVYEVKKAFNDDYGAYEVWIGDDSFSFVRCYFLSAQEVSSIGKGDRVTITGCCIGSYTSRCTMRACELVN